MTAWTRSSTSTSYAGSRREPIPLHRLHRSRASQHVVFMHGCMAGGCRILREHRASQNPRCLPSRILPTLQCCWLRRARAGSSSAAAGGGGGGSKAGGSQPASSREWLATQARRSAYAGWLRADVVASTTSAACDCTLPPRVAQLAAHRRNETSPLACALHII
jgi:hypothetical protein